MTTPDPTTRARVRRAALISAAPLAAVTGLSPDVIERTAAKHRAAAVALVATDGIRRRKAAPHRSK